MKCKAELTCHKPEQRNSNFCYWFGARHVGTGKIVVYNDCPCRVLNVRQLLI